jgi:hypothetical protein
MRPPVETFMCKGKHKHLTYEAAKKELRRPAKNDKPIPKGLKIGIFKCTFCGFYHIGKAMKDRK